MAEEYEAPKLLADAFNCPQCGTFAHQNWPQTGIYGGSFIEKHSLIRLSLCARCHDWSVWVNGRLVEPATSTAPRAHADLPPEVRALYDEARNVLGASPKSAAALLRLALQTLLPHLGQPGEHINDEIAALVKAGMPVRLQQALDIVRVVGNNAVHPGTIQLDEQPEIAAMLFGLINQIVDTLIAEPKKIEALYELLPEGAREGIKKRDGEV